MVAGYIMSTMKCSAEISLFKSTLKQNYAQQINYQLSRAKAIACCALSRLDLQAQKQAQDVLKWIEKRGYGLEAGQQGEQELKGFQMQVDQAQMNMINIGVSPQYIPTDSIDGAAYVLEHLQSIIGCGCNSSGWSGILEVFTECGIEWKNV